MWETLEDRRMMSVTLASTSTLPYIESQQTTTVDGGTTTEAQRTTSTISNVQKKLSDTQNAVISKMP
jgi:hypothetical protein